MRWIPSVSWRRRAVRVVLGGTAMFGGMGSAFALAPSTASASIHRHPSVPTYYQVTGLFGSDAVHADGATWKLSGFVGGAPAGSGSPDGIEIDLHRTFDSGTSTEFHEWLFSVPESSLKAGTTAGDWTFAPPSTATSTLATINMKFKAMKATNLTCAFGSATKYTGTFTGEFLLHTGFSKAATVGSKTISFSGASFTGDNHCSQRAHTPTCWGGVAYAGLYSTNPYQGLSGYPTKEGTVFDDELYANRTRVLSSPKNTIRLDSASELAPPIALKGSVAKVSTRSGGIITGSATVTGSGTPTTGSPITCQISGVKHTETEKSWPSATVMSPSTARITAHFALTPTITFAASGAGTLDQYIVK